MVVAGKIFKFSNKMRMEDVGSKLDGYHNEETYEEEGYNLQLLTEISGLLPKGNTLTGIYSHDYVMQMFFTEASSTVTSDSGGNIQLCANRKYNVPSCC